MSGSGMISPRRSMPPRYQAAINSAVEEERKACIDLLREKIAEVESIQKRGRCTVAEARMLVRRLDAVADAIGQGLHR